MKHKPLLFIFLLFFTSCHKKNEVAPSEKSEVFYRQIKDNAYNYRILGEGKLYTNEETIALLDSAIKYSPEYYAYYGEKVDVLTEMENYKEAIVNTRTALSKKESHNGYAALGLLYDIVGENDSSAYYYKKALSGLKKLKGDDKELAWYYKLIYNYMLNGDLQQLEDGFHKDWDTLFPNTSYRHDMEMITAQRDCIKVLSKKYLDRQNQ